jgi:plastocyanin
MRRRIALLMAALPLILTLGWAAAGAALAGGGCHGANTVEAWPAEGVATVVKIDGCTFAPTVTRVPLGAEVRFLNTSRAGHDIVGRAGAWGTDRLDSGAEFSYRFTTPGVYPYSCSLHPGMAGVVVVGDAVATAAEVTDDEIAPVAASAPIEPAGESTSPLPLLATGGLGLVAGLVIGAAIVRRRGEPA